MSLDRHDRVSELYHAASAHPPEKRDAFLTEACGEDDALRAKSSRYCVTTAPRRGSSKHRPRTHSQAMGWERQAEVR